MTVVGTEIKADRARRASGVALALYAVALVAAFLGSIGWVLGAAYTLRGWVIALNWLAYVLTLPDRLVQPVGYFVLIALPLGLVYSLIEIFLRPRKSIYARLYKEIGLKLTGLILLLWLFIIATDMGSTFLSVVTPAPGASTLAVQVSQSFFAAGVWTVVLSFVPETLFVLAYTLVRKASKWSN